jgi:DNA polymerase I-like protein with 3'-5' exonuclease and polymerase domains
VTFFRREIRDAVTLDFETDPIADRPNYPPEPVGLGVRYPDATSEYWAWGHPCENNCSKADVRDFLMDLFRTPEPKLFFNAKFDLAVACEKLGLPMPPWEEIHDSMFLAFLADPHSRSLGLKDLAEYILDWPADEQNELYDWIWDNRKQLIATYGGKISKTAKYGPSSFGAWISKTPGKLAGKYGVADVGMTFGLFEHLYPIICENRMSEAYDRERQVLPILMENERDGMRVAAGELQRDVPLYKDSLERADAKIGKLLGVPGINIDADAQLAMALTEAGVIHEDDWIYTSPTERHPKGQKSVSKDNLTYGMFQDEDVADLLFYRNRLTTALNTFLIPWERQATARDGIISTNWHQVRGGQGGTRTGRPSSSNPNFLNVPKEFKQEYNVKPNNKWKLKPLPFVRQYVKADKNQLFCHRDFDGQEMRVFAHYEDGDLLAAYQADPNLDPHGWVKDEIFEMTGRELERTPVKIMNFQGLYGGGVPAIMKALSCTRLEAVEFKAFHNKALPGREKLNQAIKEIIYSGEPIRTWGGRVYFCEPPKGRQEFLYKLINYLCQGSAADITKEVLIRWYNHPKREARFLVTVYDEINISAEKKYWKEQMLILKECMESVKLDLIMTSSGKVGPRWGELEKCA